MKRAEKKKHDALIVLFGATGDLSLKKIIPSLYTLFSEGFLKQSKVLCVSRRDMTPAKLVQEAKEHIDLVKGYSLSEFSKKLVYVRHDFNDKDEYDALCGSIHSLQKKEKLKNRIFYLSTSPKFYDHILTHIQKHKLHKNEGRGFSKVVLEKPFGEDLASALKINRKLQRVFSEDQIYRTDHYLAKNIVQDMIALRSTNRVFSPIWKKEHVDHIQIILSEDFGVATRGAFYDKYGALKDVVQNHILQLLAISLIDDVHHLNDKILRDQKIEILKNIRVEKVVVGQYKGYRKEKGVSAQSTIETCAALKVFVNIPRWKGIPIYLLTGKHLQKRLSSVHIAFKKADSTFLGGSDFESNYLTFQIQPNQGFYLRLNAKDPEHDTVAPVRMSFCHNCMFPNSPAAYTKLLEEIIEGNMFFFVRSDEVALQWKIIDRIARKKKHLYTYTKGTVPQAVHDLIERDKRSWKLDIEG